MFEVRYSIPFTRELPSAICTNCHQPRVFCVPFFPDNLQVSKDCCTFAVSIKVKRDLSKPSKYRNEKPSLPRQKPRIMGGARRRRGQGELERVA